MSVSSFGKSRPPTPPRRIRPTTARRGGLFSEALGNCRELPDCCSRWRDCARPALLTSNGGGLIVPLLRRRTFGPATPQPPLTAPPHPTHRRTRKGTSL